MVVDFDKMEETLIERFRGGEKVTRAKMIVDELNKIMLATLEPGASIGMHMHEGNSEIIYVLEGNGKMLYDGGSERLEAGMCHYCPKGHSHSLVNDSEADLKFFAVVPEQ